MRAPTWRRRPAGALAAAVLAGAASAVLATALPDPVRLTVADNAYGDADPTWSPDGGYIAYESRDGNPAFPSIYYVATAGGSETEWIGAGEAYPDYCSPAYSPDGTRVAYAKKDGDWYHLYVRPTAGGTATPLTTGTAGPPYGAGGYGDLQPAWSPDGQWIAFSSSRGDLQNGMLDIWVVRADGTGLKRVTSEPAADTGSPSWSPDGGRLVFSRNDEVWTVARTGGTNWGGAARLWDGGNRPCFSPSGSHIAYDAGGDIYVRAYPAGAPVPITTGPDQDTGACWSPDGKAIVFSSDRGDGARALWVANGVDQVPALPVTLGRVKASYR